MRDFPADVAALIEPPPKWFTIHPHVAKSGVALRWGVAMGTRDAGIVEFEYGLPIRSGSQAEMAQLTEQLRVCAWQIHELVRLHRLDLVAFARVDRHSNRPARGRRLTDEAKKMLADVQAAHRERLERGRPRPSEAQLEV